MSVLANELESRGHRVTFLGFPDMKDILPAGTGFVAFGGEDWPLGSLKPYIGRLARLGGVLSIRRLMLDLAAFTDTICTALPHALEQLKPDFLIIDQTDAAGSLVATALSVPFINIANALPLNIEPGVPPPVLPWRYDPSPKGIKRNEGGYRVARLIERPITNAIRSHAERLGRPDIRFADESWSTLGQITQCVRGLDFPRERLPPNFHYVGPMRGVDGPLDLPLPASGKPLIFCSLGTLQGSRISIFRAVAKAAADLDVDLVIAHGGMLNDEDIKRLPRRPIVHSYVPQRALLPRCALAITHCGFNTVLDSLSFGVPIVGLPITFEQPATAARLQRVGAAEVIHRWRTARRVRHAVEQVLADSGYRESAGRLAAEISLSGGTMRAADIIEGVIGGAHRATSTTVRGARDDARGDNRSENS
jgi:MGT family glycosyltransferase